MKLLIVALIISPLYLMQLERRNGRINFIKSTKSY